MKSFAFGISKSEIMLPTRARAWKAHWVVPAVDGAVAEGAHGLVHHATRAKLLFFNCAQKESVCCCSYV
jgi:hypothetical protein